MTISDTKSALSLFFDAPRLRLLAFGPAAIRLYHVQLGCLWNGRIIGGHAGLVGPRTDRCSVPYYRAFSGFRCTPGVIFTNAKGLAQPKAQRTTQYTPPAPPLGRGVAADPCFANRGSFLRNQKTQKHHQTKHLKSQQFKHNPCLLRHLLHLYFDASNTPISSIPSAASSRTLTTLDDPKLHEAKSTTKETHISPLLRQQPQQRPSTSRTWSRASASHRYTLTTKQQAI